MEKVVSVKLADAVMKQITKMLKKALEEEPKIKHLEGIEISVTFDTKRDLNKINGCICISRKGKISRQNFSYGKV